MSGTLTPWVRQVLGDHSIVGRPSATERRSGSGQHVIEVVDSTGEHWFAKQVAEGRAFRVEVRAYRHWVPALGGFAPSLKAFDRDLRTLLISSVPGEQASVNNREVHHRAGQLLRRLHGSCPARKQEPAQREYTSRRLALILATNPDLFTPAQVAFTRDQATRIAELPVGESVPCHGDYLPHNWLVDSANVLRIIDFGESRWDLPAFDFSKLFFNAWWRRPRLAASFFAGYGRQPTELELEFIRLRMATRACAEVAFGHNRGSQQHVDHGHARLSDLMAGYQVGIHEGPPDPL